MSSRRSSLGPVLILAAAFAATAVLGMLVLVLTGGLSSDQHRRGHARAMVELLLYALHRRPRPDLDLTPATATPQPGTTSASRRAHASRRH